MKKGLERIKKLCLDRLAEIRNREDESYYLPGILKKQALVIELKRILKTIDEEQCIPLDVPLPYWYSEPYQMTAFEDGPLSIDGKEIVFEKPQVSDNILPNSASEYHKITVSGEDHYIPSWK